MRAVVIFEHGGPEVLSLVEDYRDPEVGPRDVLVEVRATALNHLDIWVREGLPSIVLPRILGSDISGVVKEVGVGVERFKLGDEVARPRT
ncbi:MAG: alcohol dehydrogenase catalytic domain-containing protein [Candidatus Korarchaeota archaeon]|nr:alcohol dehydrogenase catalytic domain-containing protein [Candidatus Korarchaeota archaeon]